MTTETAAPTSTGAAEQDHLFTLDPTRAYPVLERADGIRVWDTRRQRVPRCDRRDRGRQHRLRPAGGRRRDRRRRPRGCRTPSATSSRPSPRSPSPSGSRVSRPATSTTCIFTSGGSEAVEVALKMARQYHVLRGEPDRVGVRLALDELPRGDARRRSRSAASKLRRKVYEPMLLQTPHVRTPYCYRCPWPDAHPDCGAAAAAEVEARDPGRRTRPGGRRDRGADHRVGRRRDPAAGRLLAAGARDLRPPRRAAHPRRGAHRLRTNRAPFRAPTTGASCPTCS